MFQCNHQRRGGEDWVIAVNIYYRGKSCSCLWRVNYSTGRCACPRTMSCHADLQSPETLGCCYIYTARKTAHKSLHRTSCKDRESLVFQSETPVRYSFSSPMSPSRVRAVLHSVAEWADTVQKRSALGAFGQP